MVADNYLFLNLTECIEWCRKNIKNFYDSDEVFDDFLQLHDLEDVKYRLLDHIIDTNDNDDVILEGFLSQYNDKELSLLFYKNNIIKFIEDHEEIQDLFIQIFENVENLKYADENDEWMTMVPPEYIDTFKPGSTVDDYNSFVNKMYFMDPNSPPDTIQVYLELMSQYMMKYVYCKYMSMDRIYRLKNFERQTVTVIDTDSNILSLDPLVHYIFDNVLHGQSFERSDRNNMFIIINTLAYTLTNAVQDILLTYGKYSNIPEEFRPIYNMKNEFGDSINTGFIIFFYMKNYKNNKIYNNKIYNMEELNMICINSTGILETFKPVLNDNGDKTKFLVSDCGRVYNSESDEFVIPYIQKYWNSSWTNKRRLAPENKWRACVILNDGKWFFRGQISRLELKTFKPLEDYTGMEVDHIDNDPRNDALDNLQWITSTENKKKSAELRGRTYTEYDDDLIHQICQAVILGKSRKQIRKELNVRGQLIDDITSGRSHKKISSQYVDKGFTYRLYDKKERIKRQDKVRTICDLIDKGYENADIVRIMRLPKNEVCLPNDIRKFRIYKYISKDYAFFREANKDNKIEIIYDKEEK